ncbi:solute carrier family 2, facilitated glucose transporter member 5-like isoform X2 [Leucoraja erinacea]|uniref:solute carrier family 2, facilitated glucose transporter member 5-like isoform X2 n=1 Tax=Leucoraja erinaceus TaxID=7782 RepID=UPI002453B0C0|nr:solute carrier family 2, facilitated glucose transporter member 5-like isoform X2 [Leucoraja erinacea]
MTEAVVNREAMENQEPAEKQDADRNQEIVENQQSTEAFDASGARKGRLTLVLGLATLVSVFGSSFQYGYNVAVINSPSLHMQAFYNTSYFERNGKYIDSDFLTLLWSLTVSMYPLGGFFGSLMVAPLVNKLGRKGTLLLNNIFSIIPAIMMGSSKGVKSFEIIIIARIIIGICAGLSSNVVPMYLGELSPKNLRGALGVAPQLFITIGILIAQLFGLRKALANEKGWPLLLALTGIPAVVELIFLPFFPESPRYMLIQKGDEKGAKAALRRLRGWDDVDAEIEEMHLEDQSEKAEGRLSVMNLCSFKALRWQLITVIVLNMGQQLSGVNAIYYYADNIYRSAGVLENDIQYVTVATGSVNVFMTIAATAIIDKAGRRLLLLIGFAVCCSFCMILTMSLNLQSVASNMSYLSIASIFLYVIGHAIGPSPIPYVITTEIFRQSSRPAAFMVAGSVHWLSNFLVGLIFPFLERGLGEYSFIIFGFICLLTFVYIYLFIPETKNKTFQEISEIMAKKNKVEIKLETDPLNPSGWEEDQGQWGVDKSTKL